MEVEDKYPGREAFLEPMDKCTTHAEQYKQGGEVWHSSSQDKCSTACAMFAHPLAAQGQDNGIHLHHPTHLQGPQQHAQWLQAKVQGHSTANLQAGTVNSEAQSQPLTKDS